MNRILAFCVRTVLLGVWVLYPTCVAGQTDPFSLHDGDRVVFYGDSITEQQYYTRFVELYTLTRFPSMKVSFIMSGVSGDKVSGGGGGGPVDQRLPRDVFSYKPTIVTIMLGMNDGYYHPYDAGTLRTYELGFEHILDEIKVHAPDARVVVLRPSPYDEITQPGKGIANYNSFLIKMGDSIARMASDHHLTVADLNSPIVAGLTAASTSDPNLAPLLIADHVHPGPGMHWIMADAILKSWNAPPIVNALTLDALRGAVVSVNNSNVSEVKREGDALSWSQKDNALPLPFPAPAADPLTTLALRSSTVVADLDQQTLTIDHLPTGRYELRIDGGLVATYSNEELANGINLATLDTPMLRQARLVFLTNDSKISLDTTRNHLLRNVPSAVNDSILAAVNDALHTVDDEQHRQAQPVMHHFSVRPAR
jgi:lysophospholipase L1-like esterase